MISSSIHYTVVAILVGARQQRRHSKAVVVLRHLYSFPYNNENEKHVENFVLIAICVLVAVC